MRAEEAFHQRYGKALAQWAYIEQRLYFWFARLTGLEDQMARAIFYSSRSFTGRRDMLASVLEATSTPDHVKAFLREAIKRASTYSSFRNALAHGEIMIEGTPDGDLTGRLLLMQGRHPPIAGVPHITIETVDIATNNYMRLSTLMMDGLDLPWEGADSKLLLQACHERLLQLPSEADSKKPGRKQLGRLRQQKPSRRKPQK